MCTFIALKMDGSIYFTVYWALSIKASTFFTQTRFHVPVKQLAKHTPSSLPGCNQSHQYNSKATPFPKCPPCMTQNLSTCLFCHLKQAAEALSQQQTCWKQFVSFCNLTRPVDLPLCTLWGSMFPSVRQHPPGSTFMESSLGNTQSSANSPDLIWTLKL